MSATRLAYWLQLNTPDKPDQLTHLKLQKLLFYAYGAAVAARVESELGALAFEAWAHGPVNREVWNRYRVHGGAPIPHPTERPERYSAALEATLRDTINVYGRLTAWNLRQETHLEEPWIEAWNQRAPAIDDTQLRAYFSRKFSGHVSFPEYLFRGSTFELDGIPLPHFSSLHDVSRAVSQTLGD